MTGTNFAIPFTSQERNVAAKFQPNRLCGLAGEIEMGDGWTVHDTLSGIPISYELKKRLEIEGDISLLCRCSEDH